MPGDQGSWYRARYLRIRRADLAFLRVGTCLPLARAGFSRGELAVPCQQLRVRDGTAPAQRRAG